MSEIIVVVLLIVPVVLAVVILNYSNKKQKRNAHNKLSAYVSQITNQLQIKQSFWRRILYQLVLIDDESREMIVVNHKDNHLSHELFSMDMIESIKVVSLKQTVSFGDRNKKTDAITTQIGVEISFTKPRQDVLLVVYDHVAHNILQMAELEKEARQLHDDINKFRTAQLISA